MVTVAWISSFKLINIYCNIEVLNLPPGLLLKFPLVVLPGRGSWAAAAYPSLTPTNQTLGTSIYSQCEFFTIRVFLVSVYSLAQKTGNFSRIIKTTHYYDNIHVWKILMKIYKKYPPYGESERRIGSPGNIKKLRQSTCMKNIASSKWSTEICLAYEDFFY